MNWLPLQTVAQTSVERIFNALPEGFLIALFVWALLRVLRRQNSGTRFAVWFLALLAVAALPVLGGFGAGLFAGLFAGPFGGPGQGRALLAWGISAPVWASLRPAIVIPAIVIPGGWALFVFLAWILGACVAMARLGTGLWRLRQLRRSCTPVVAADLDPAVRKIIEFIGASKSSSKRVIVATSECVRVPAAIGFWKRTIVLPAWALRELPPEDLNVILLHEFAHLRRGDDWTNLIQKMVRALFFFHPAVWWIESRLSVEREMACDDAVLAETANPHGYASCLVTLLEKSFAHSGWPLAQAAVHRAREASLRLAQILDRNRPVATRVWKPALGMVAAFSVICLAHAPQFVAFDRGLDQSMLASNSGHTYSAAVRPVSFQLLPAASGELGVPVRLDASAAPSASLGASAAGLRRSTPGPRAASHRPASAPVVSARLNAAAPGDRVVAISASAGRETAPRFRTLVFIEATQYRTADSSVWSVQVWRVTFVSTVPGRLAGAPVANSI